MITSKKIGKIRVALALINDQPEVVQLIMASFIPLKADIMPEGWIEYIGISEWFDERGEGYNTPIYTFTMKRNPDGKVYIIDVTKD